MTIESSPLKPNGLGQPALKSALLAGIGEAALELAKTMVWAGSIVPKGVRSRLLTLLSTGKVVAVLYSSVNALDQVTIA